MNWSKKSRLFLIVLLAIILITPPIPKTMGQGYGEDSDSLDQFVDDYENDDNVTVAYQVINNQTLDCMELNYSTAQSVSDDVFQLREHKRYAAQNPSYTWSIVGGEELHMDSTVAAIGFGWEFIVIDKEWLSDKYVRFRWKYFATAAVFPMYFVIQDGSYDRTNNTEFPNGADTLFYGAGRFIIYQEVGVGSNEWVIRDIFANLTLSQLSEVTIMWLVTDGWTEQDTGGRLDWIEINENSGGSNNLWRIDFNESEAIVMEQTGTIGDYGYVNNSGLPISLGDYESEGYFITDDYLNYTTGNCLVQLTNSTIPSGTSLTVQFSNDNVTWLDNEGNIGSTTIGEGFYSIDLRDLNYTDTFIMYNFTGNGLSTPRLYQSRLITTEGPPVPPDYSIIFLAIGLILMLAIAFLYVKSR